mgnify:CR=1 FL=1
MVGKDSMTRNKIRPFRLQLRMNCWAIVDDHGDVAYIDNAPQFFQGEPCGSVTSRGRTKEELAAIASLFAAAPALLQACWDALQEIALLEGQIANLVGRPHTVSQFGMRLAEVIEQATTGAVRQEPPAPVPAEQGNRNKARYVYKTVRVPGVEKWAADQLDMKPHGFLPGQRRALRGMMNCGDPQARLAAVRYLCRDIAHRFEWSEDGRYIQGFRDYWQDCPDLMESCYPKPVLRPVPHIA